MSTITTIQSTDAISASRSTINTNFANLNTDKAELSGATFTGDINVPDEAYGAGWNGSTEVPTKNAIYDKIETMGGGGATTFLGLTDTPSSYVGQALKVVQVNAGATGLEFVTASGGGDALTANPLSQFASTTSAQLAGVISDETGSGSLVFGTSPNITTPTGIVKGDVGLGNVDNTSDVNKPISTATQTALNAKANQATTYTKTETDVFNPDFYQYSIVPTVVSGNLTVALKNYEGNDPTPTKPVKIMIGGVVRTITSALSNTFPAGTNWYNSGSVELATKEIDYFVFIIWATDNSPRLACARIPNGTTKQDFSASGTYTNEKYLFDSNLTTDLVTDPVVNIGRFNATLSAGAGYTWSIPATSVIVNSPIYFGRFLDYNPTLTWNGTVPTGPVGSSYKYRVAYDSVDIDNYTGYSSAGTSNTNVQITLPFSVKDKGTMGAIITAGTTPGAIYCDLPAGGNTATIYTSTLAYVDRVGMNGFYNI